MTSPPKIPFKKAKERHQDDIHTEAGWCQVRKIFYLAAAT